MNNYELTIVIPGGATAAKKKAAQERIEKLVKLFSGTVTSMEDWGEIELSYKIKKNENGVYLHFLIEMEASDVKAISDKMRTEDEIIRHLLVTADKKRKVKAKKTVESKN